MEPTSCCCRVLHLSQIPTQKDPPDSFASLPFIIFHFATAPAPADELSQHLQIFLLSLAPSLCAGFHQQHFTFITWDETPITI